MRSDVELMLKAKAGSTVAFDWLVKRHFKPVVQFFYWRLWDKSQAEDLAQEVFIKLFSSLASYDPRGQFKSYLFSIATNHLRDHMRRVKVRPTYVSLNSSGDDDDGDLLDKLTGVEMPPEANLELDETSQKLADALSELPEDQYLVFTMHKHEGLKYEEIAERLDVKLGTIKSRMNTVYQHLRRAVFGPEQAVPGIDDAADSTGTSSDSTLSGPGASARKSKRKKNSSTKSGAGSKRSNAKRSGLRKPEADPGDDAEPAADATSSGKGSKRSNARRSGLRKPEPTPEPADDPETPGDGLDTPDTTASAPSSESGIDAPSRERAASEVTHGDDAGA